MHRDLSLIARERGDLPAALAGLRSALDMALAGQTSPDQLAGLHGEIAELESATGNPAAAIASYSDAFAASQDPEYLYLRCVAELRLNRIADARESCGAASEHAPANPVYLDALLYVMQRQRAFTDAELQLKRALSRFPGSEALLARAGKLRQAKGEARNLPMVAD